MHAAREGDLDMLQLLVQHGMTSDDSGVTYVMTAAYTAPTLRFTHCTDASVVVWLYAFT